MGDFGVWAPWVFSAIALIAGWVLRWWYDEGKFSEFNDRLEAKDRDIFHLNEAHNLLLQDKKTKISDNSDELAMKDRVIKELSSEVRQLKSSLSTYETGKVKTTKSKKALANPATKAKKKEVVASIAKSSSNPVSIVSTIDKRAKNKKGGGPLKDKVTEKAKVKSEQQIVETTISSDHFDSVNRKKSISRKGRLKKKLLKSREKIKVLQAENKNLTAQLSTEKKEKVKEAPITITKTILVKERVDRKKLKKALKNVPFKKSRKVSSKVTSKRKE